jgi:hypothetical protein
MKTVAIDGAAIVDGAAFHQIFADAFGFPAFYGRNMDAWIDCMGYLDEPKAEMSEVHLAPGEVLTIAVLNADRFKSQCPEMWLSFLECAAFVNWRLVDKGKPAIVAISASA